MQNTGYNANHSKRTQDKMIYNTNTNNGWDTYRMFCFVEHLDTCQNISAMAIMYKDELDRVEEPRKPNIRSSR